ncbi:MAG TPA: hypothetical protein VF941_12170, partial [Clostridia bacterium]
MALRLILFSFLKTRNLAILIAGFVVIYILQRSFPQVILPIGFKTAYCIAAATYLFSVFLNLFSHSFHEEFSRNEKRRKVQIMDINFKNLVLQYSRYLAKDHRKRLSKVIDAKDKIVGSYLLHKASFLREKIADQSLNTAISYIKLLNVYSFKTAELKRTGLSEVADRLAMNKRKLDFSKDPQTCDDLKNLIELDEKLLSDFNKEKNELQRIDARLSYLEGIMDMLSYRFMSN